MSNIRLVLADLDGTIVKPEAQDASQIVKDTLREAGRNGVKFAAITGRPFWRAKDLLKAMALMTHASLKAAPLLSIQPPKKYFGQKHCPLI